MKLAQPNAPWFQDVMHLSGMHDLCRIGYGYINHELLSGFVDRWHIETSSLHLLIIEMFITLNDMACLIHLPIT